jgi:hypothetical protein
MWAAESVGPVPLEVIVGHPEWRWLRQLNLHARQKKLGRRAAAGERPELQTAALRLEEVPAQR